VKTFYGIEQLREMLTERAETTDRDRADDIDRALEIDARNMAEVLVDIHDIVTKARFVSQHVSEADLWRSIVIEVMRTLDVTAAEQPPTT
jgi:hypothetical protein